MNKKRLVVPFIVLVCLTMTTLVVSEPTKITPGAESEKVETTREQPESWRSRISGRVRGIMPPKANEAKNDNPDSSSPEPLYLKEIAAMLSVLVAETDTPGDIAFKIKQRLEKVEKYHGDILSEESASNIRDAILSKVDLTTFDEYHSFIKKIADKRILIIE